MRDKKLQSIVRMAAFSAIIAVLAQISLPLPNGVPITLQTFAIALCGFFLGPKAVISVIIYILVGALGIPVFAKLSGGIGTITGTTGGFIVGFIPMALLCGISKLFNIKDIKSAGSIIKIVFSLILAVIGLAVCHLMGTYHFATFTKRTFLEALPLVSYPFLIKDVLSIFLAYILSFSIELRLNPSSRKIQTY